MRCPVCDHSTKISAAENRTDGTITWTKRWRTCRSDYCRKRFISLEHTEEGLNELLHRLSTNAPIENNV